MDFSDSGGVVDVSVLFCVVELVELADVVASDSSLPESSLQAVKPRVSARIVPETRMR